MRRSLGSTVNFYQVGGSVRDELLSLPSKDRDYAVEAPNFSAMRDAILARNGEIFLETPQYFTIRARVPNLGACDFVLCRKDGAYSDGRRPDTVEVGTIYDDLARRDFTVNALAKREDGTILDPHGGEADLRLQLLKCVGRTEDRFTEDGLRLLRAMRFAITKNLQPDTEIRSCLCDYKFLISRLTGVSVERVREELFKCFQYNTLVTLGFLRDYQALTAAIWTLYPTLWLKPTTETR